MKIQKYLLFFFLLSKFSCSPSEEYGNITVLWRIGGTTCSDAGVLNVEINLLKGKEIEASQKELCGLGQATIGDIPAGKYKIEIYGYNISNKKTHKGVMDEVKVSANKTTTIPQSIILTQIPASIILKWHFKNGKLCAFNAVTNVEVTIWDGNQNSIFTKEYPCEPSKEDPSFQDGGMLIDNLKADNLTIELFGLGSPPEKTRLFRGTTKVKTINGERTEVDIELLRCDEEINCK